VGGTRAIQSGESFGISWDATGMPWDATGEKRLYVLAVAQAKRPPLYWLARCARDPG
jgi:hypothetical protein